MLEGKENRQIVEDKFRFRKIENKFDTADRGVAPYHLQL